MRRTLKLATLVVAATVAGAVLAEAGGQLYFRATNGHWLWEDGAFRTNTTVGYTAPTGDRRQYALLPNYHGRDVTVDDRGFRQTVPAPEPGDRLIVNIGDSVVFGTGATDSEPYSAQLARRFRMEGLPLGVINAGVPSYTTWQSFERLRVDVERYYPASRIAAVTFTAANDISLVFEYNAGYAPELTWAAERRLIPMRPGWHRFAGAYYLGRADAAYAQRRLPSPTRVPEQSAEQRMLESVRSTLRAELAPWRDRGVPVILLPVNPFTYQLSGTDANPHLRVLREVYNGALWEIRGWDHLIRQFNDQLREVADEFPNAHYIETRAIFDAEDRNPLYLDYLHLSEAGHRRMAEILYDAFARYHVIDRAPATK